MGPLLPPAAQAMQVFGDPAVRVQVRQWHSENVPFLDMIDRLGLGKLFVGDLRAAITGLTDDEVAIIRKAMVAAIDRAGDTEGASFPIACKLDDVKDAVTVTALDKSGEPWALVVAK